MRYFDERGQYRFRKKEHMVTVDRWFGLVVEHFFPELSKRVRWRVSRGKSLAYFSYDCETEEMMIYITQSACRLDCKSLAFTVAHELSHCLQELGEIPGGEKRADFEPIMRSAFLAEGWWDFGDSNYLVPPKCSKPENWQIVAEVARLEEQRGGHYMARFLAGLKRPAVEFTGRANEAGQVAVAVP